MLLTLSCLYISNNLLRSELAQERDYLINPARLLNNLIGGCDFLGPFSGDPE